ncbi:MAG: hypothetical protein ACI9YM_000202 [Brevundimonas sp.]|jgi:hypothetical protein|uniref:hypothetical protein n=1 Tax=Brevundimonas sp. TaxID=1871086 RepID=UPI002489DD29|nr:hypothetical protein [Brevundimonas sp.]MDI1280362.1 hypothetical protein [Brevundimonas sp.]
MKDLIGWGFGLLMIAGVVWATLAMARSRPAGKRRGGLGLMAAALFGLGAALDPPQRHIVEAKEPPKGSPETGEPGIDD